MRTITAFAASLLIILTACGDQAKVVSAGRSGVNVAHENASPKPGEEHNRQGQKSAQGSTPDTNGARNSRGQSSPAPSQAFNNTLPMETELSPVCGSRGSLMTLKIQTRKGASISIAVGYSDGDSYGNYQSGAHADDEGRYTYTWVIPAEAPSGNARVLVGAADYSAGPDEYSGSSTGESATALVSFRVANSC